jgi:hypothetical protein
MLARDKAARAELVLRFAEERLAEAAEMTRRERPEYIPALMEDYEAAIVHTHDAVQAVADVDTMVEVTEGVATATMRHMEVLEEVAAMVPGPAKPAIQRAMEASRRGQEDALTNLGEAAPERGAAMYFKLAEKNLLKAMEKTERGEEEVAVELITDYERKMSRAMELVDRAEKLGRNTSEVNQLILEATSMHLEVLRDIHGFVPAPARAAIEKAINASSMGQRMASRALGMAGAPAQVLPPPAERARAGKQADGGVKLGPPEWVKPPVGNKTSPPSEEKRGLPEKPVTPSKAAPSSPPAPPVSPGGGQGSDGDGDGGPPSTPGRPGKP